MQTVHEVSAGGVVLARDPLRVALCRVISPKGEHRWVLPKGIVEAAESSEETARREVLEETGLEVEVAGLAGDVDYWFVWDGTRRHKRVRFFTMWATGGDFAAHDAEVEEVAWFEPDAAVAAMAYDGERRIVRDSLSQVASQ